MKEVTVTLDESFLKKFFEMTGTEVEDDYDITLAMLRKNLDILDEMVKDAKKANKKQASAQRKSGGSSAPESREPASNAPQAQEAPVFQGLKKTIFVIDDLGVITYQLKVIFEGMGYDVITSNDIYNAIDKFKRTKCDFVLMDLFIPTEREGLILLKELKKLMEQSQRVVKIGVMTTSTKREHRQICKMKGADFYFEKEANWQDQIRQAVTSI